MGIRLSQLSQLPVRPLVVGQSKLEFFWETESDSSGIAPLQRFVRGLEEH